MSTSRTHRAVVALLAAVTMLTAGCTGDGSGTADSQSPITNEDVPAMDIANLPDIEATRAQMLDLIERVRAEVVRLVPASAPWETKYEESSEGCKRDGKQGVTVYFAKLVSPRRFTPEEWAVALPAVQRLAADAGLTETNAMQDTGEDHDIRFNSADGRELVFGSMEASLITGSIACRMRAEGKQP
jgi:hypothetical protein